jgi:hypothetical protein
MAFSDMNDVEQELGEEKPPQKGTNRTFLVLAGILGGIMVLALLCIAGLALFRYLPGQRTAQSVNATNIAQSVNATNAVRATELALAGSQTALAHPATATTRPTTIPTNTQVPTNTPVIVLGPTKSPTLDVAIATRNAILTLTAKPSATPAKPTSTGLPDTGIAEELGTPGLLAAAFILVVIIFLMRRLRTAS